jgi:hypothetical protein
MKNEAPRDVHIKELYSFVENNVELTETQLQLHIQIAGQEEQNWMHDLRNLLNTAKSNSVLINPSRNCWALPRRNKSIKLSSDLCFDIMVKRASVAFNQGEIFTCIRTKSEFGVKQYSATNIEIIVPNSSKKYNLSKGMVVSKIEHLINCGGELELGMLHKWSIIESAILLLCDKIRLEKSNFIRIDSN